MDIVEKTQAKESITNSTTEFQFGWQGGKRRFKQQGFRTHSTIGSSQVDPWFNIPVTPFLHRLFGFFS